MRAERLRFYGSQLLAEAPRLLSRLDRCPVSASRGCFDREYWAWATKDFANIDLQRAVLVLAYLYRTEFEGNGFAGQGALLEWLGWAVEFWLRRQDRDGAFDHLYPREGSWMAAAFTLADMAEAYGLLGERVEAGLRGRWLEAMRRCGDHLARRDERHGFISNHRTAAAAALLRLAGLTGEDRFRGRAWRLAEEVYERQSSEGWFLEYEGADPGYETLGLHYQALLYQAAGERQARVLEAAARSLAFLSHFMHPDGSVGGEYGSRGCPQFFPGGIEVFAERAPAAEAMARLGAKALAAGDSCGLRDSDGRNSVPLAASLVLAHRTLLSGAENPCEALPWERTFAKTWPEAGLHVRSTPEAYVVFGASKGGVVKVYDKRRACLSFSSCGYAGELADGSPVSTQLWTPRPALEASGDDRAGEASVEAPFFRFRTDRLMSTAGLVLFRLFMLSAGRLRAAQDRLRSGIIGRYLKAREPAGASLRRRLVFSPGSIVVEDRISAGPGAALRSLREHGFFSTVYMASARYFRRQDLAQAWSGPDLSRELGRGEVLRTRTLDASGRAP